MILDMVFNVFFINLGSIWAGIAGLRRQVLPHPSAKILSSLRRKVPVNLRLALCVDHISALLAAAV